MIFTDKDSLKEYLTPSDIFDIIEYLGGEPFSAGGNVISRTICHNPAHEGSHKLYYYDNTRLFHCYTACPDSSFDIFDLVLRIKKCSLPQAIQFVASYFGHTYSSYVEGLEDVSTAEDWRILNSKDKIDSVSAQVELKTFDDTILKYLPSVRILDWEKEGILDSVVEKHNIKFNPITSGIVIPHYDKDNNLIGIRERTLVKENEIYGKYRPSILNGVMYNHPLGLALYNLNVTKDNINKAKIAIVAEGEKSSLLSASYFGIDNNLCVACCGSSLSAYQVQLLEDCGAKEMVIAFDKQFKEEGDQEWENWTKKLQEIHNKYNSHIRVSFMFDQDNMLGYKDSPLDRGRDTFLELFEKRIYL